MREWIKFLFLAAAFLVFYLAPIDAPVVLRSTAAGLALLQEYARLHVLTCLVPAFFIAGTIAVYVKKDAVMRLLGPTTKKYIAYPIASISGGILAATWAAISRFRRSASARPNPRAASACTQPDSTNRLSVSP